MAWFSYAEPRGGLRTTRSVFYRAGGGAEQGRPSARAVGVRGV